MRRLRSRATRRPPVPKSDAWIWMPGHTLFLIQKPVVSYRPLHSWPLPNTGGATDLRGVLRQKERSYQNRCVIDGLADRPPTRCWKVDKAVGAHPWNQIPPQPHTKPAPWKARRCRLIGGSNTRRMSRQATARLGRCQPPRHAAALGGQQLYRAQPAAGLWETRSWFGNRLLGQMRPQLRPTGRPRPQADCVRAWLGI
jgi:hypothetical protein